MSNEISELTEIIKDLDDNDKKQLLKNIIKVSDLIDIFKSLDEDDKLEFYIPNQDDIHQFTLIARRDEKAQYYKDKYKNDSEWKKKHLARQKKYYYNRKERLKKMNDKSINDAKQTD